MKINRFVICVLMLCIILTACSYNIPNTSESKQQVGGYPVSSSTTLSVTDAPTDSTTTMPVTSSSTGSTTTMPSTSAPTSCAPTKPSTSVTTTAPTTSFYTSCAPTRPVTSASTKPSTSAPTSSTTTAPVTSGTVTGTTGSWQEPGKPLASAGIDGRAAYELMKLALTDDAALEEFVDTVGKYGALLTTRDAIADFMGLLNKVPNFSIDNAKDFAIHYEPAKDMLYVVYRMSEEDQAHWYRFEYCLDKESNAEWKEQILKEAGTNEFEYIGKENNIKLLLVVDMSGYNLPKTTAKYYVEVDGMVICVWYKNIYADVPNQTPAEVFSTIGMENTFDEAVKASFR